MELDFDKEMDALLRQAARSGEIVSTGARDHLDADEISAFAENALPEKTRGVYVKHFADCDRCRIVLSNTILLNAEAQTASSTAADTAAAAPEIIEKQIPWYRRLFLMPNLAYTMGALVLAIGGMLGILVLQNINQTGEFDMAKSTANRSAVRGPNAAEDQSVYPTGESNTAAVSNAANTAANTSAEAVNSAAATNANISVAATNSVPNPALTAPSPGTDLADRSRDEKNQIAAKQKEEDFQLDGASGAENRTLAKPAEEKSAKVQGETAMREDKPKVAAAAPAPAPPPAKDDAEEARLSISKKSARTGKNTRQIGGKTFNRMGGVWIDSAYNKSLSSNMTLPPTKTVRRGSDEYRRLDKQVRIIAESLDGPVIIVWKDGAYRIQ